MRFFLAALLAVTFNVSAYGQFDTWRDEMEAYGLFGSASAFDNPWRQSEPFGIYGPLSIEGGPEGGGQIFHVPLYACRRVANSDFTIVVEEQVQTESDPVVFEDATVRVDGEDVDVTWRQEVTITSSTYLYLPNFDELTFLLDSKSGQYTFSRWVRVTYYDDEYQHTNTAYKCHHAQFLEAQIADIRQERELRERLRERNAQ